MSRNGLDGRRRGSILVQLGATAGVLVLPPLMLSAGVALFGSQTEDRLQVAADQSVASAVSKSSALIAFSPRPREIPKSAERPPLHDEPAAKAAPPPAVAEAVVVESDESSKGAETDAAAEPLPFLGPVPVTLVVVRKEPEPEEPEPEETTAAPAPPAPASAPPPVASIAPIVPHATPKPPPTHVARPRVKADREEARTPRRIAEKRPHAPAAARAPTARAAGAASHRATASASAPSKAKPKSGLQHRADLEN